MTLRRPLLSLFGAPAALLAGLAACALAPAARAAEAREQPPQFGEKTSEAFTKMQPLLESKDWDGALAALNGALAFAAPDSYDRAYILFTEAKLQIEKDDTSKAISDWEEALQLSDAHSNYFTPADRLFLILSLAQGYSTAAQNTKDAALARADFAKAAEYIRRWLAATPKPTFESENFYALVLYSQATANDKKVDMGMLRQARDAAEKALHLQIRPKESLIVLLTAIAQQSNDQVSWARYLELLVQMNPDKENYWEQLWAVYMNEAASEEKDEGKARELYALAIDTIERAQAYGKMRTKKYNYDLATMYYSAEQYGKTTELLAGGLHSGAIDPEYKNWELLSYSYQQINQPLKAIEALKEATKVPKLADNGNLDFEIGNIYAQLDNPLEAYNFYRTAVAKGNLDKPFTVYQYLAYQAYGQEKYQEAMDAVNQAYTYPQAKTNTQLATLKTEILQSLAVQKNAAEAAAADKAAPAATPAAGATQ